MASCDEDFGLLSDDAQSQHQPSSQPPRHPFAAVVAQRFVSTAPGKGGATGAGAGGPCSIPLQSASRPHHHHHQQLNPCGAGAVAITGCPSKKGVVVDAGHNDHEGYGEAFCTTGASKCAASAPAFPDPCYDESHAFATHHSQGHREEEDDDDDEAGDDNPDTNKSRGLVASAATSASLHHQVLQHQHQHQHHHDGPPKRRDRDDLSDGESPYCYNSSGAASGKRSRPISSSGGDYRKDREEWSDTAIGSLLDAYTERYVQLNRGNLRGRDWEDVATIVSERCDKQKVAKSVEQCKNKIDNLKKRYKVECQRLSSGGLQATHWPWFKKMEQIVGSSSSSSKAAQDEDKPVAIGSPASVMRQMKRYPAVASGPVTVTSNSKIKSVSNSRWKRVVLRISGSALAGSGTQNVDPKVILLIAKEIAIANHAGLEVAVVLGSRNFFCGDTWVAATGTDRAATYQIGVMASIMNAMMLQASLEKLGVETRIQSTLMMQEIAEPYIRRRAIRHLEKGRVVIFGGAGTGTGHPLFSTDTAAALRASEIHADAVLKGTTADVVYNSHLRSSNNGVFEHISFRELVSRGFTAMDMTALTLCEENNLPVVLFNPLEPGNVSKALCGDQVGTLIDHTGRIS